MLSACVAPAAGCGIGAVIASSGLLTIKLNKMKELKIYEFQAKQIEDTFRLVARTLESKCKTTSLDRDVMQSWEMIKNVLAEKIDVHVPRM